MFDMQTFGLSVLAVAAVLVIVDVIFIKRLIKLIENKVDVDVMALLKDEWNRMLGKKPAAPAPVDDGELIAVISAAVAAVLEAEAVAQAEAAGEPVSEAKASGFVVRSIRRISTAPAWNRAGREEQVYSRM